MNVMLDIIGSVMFTGILIITILTVNNNMVMSNYKSISTYEVQTQSVQLGRILEFDLYKVGYKVYGGEILFADTSRLIFRSDLEDKGRIDTIEYNLGSYMGTSANPRDRQLSRIVNGSPLFISYNATRFILTYYDSVMTKMTTPLSAVNRARVRSINVLLALETPDPIEVRLKGTVKDSLYTGSYYEKLVPTRNLSF